MSAHADRRHTGRRAWVQTVMGIPVSVHVRADDVARPDIAAAVSAAFAHLRRADAVFSTWRPDSDVMRWRSGDLALDEADPWLAAVVAMCVEAAAATDGLFTAELVGPDGSRGFDPTSLVKGWAVAGAADLLRALDAVTFSINAGGDIVCGSGRDAAHLAAPWRIGIADPADSSRIAQVVEVVDGAVATSGNAERGKHIVNPRTGRYVDRGGSVTVVGPDLTWADVGATAAFVDLAAVSGPQWSEYRVLVSADNSSSDGTPYPRKPVLSE